MNTENNSIGGFVAGTLVHTDKGLVPIENIKVGDRVLSKPENGKGEVAYKPVVNAFEFEDKEVWFVDFRNSPCYDREKIYSGELKYHQEFIVGTPNHPFWVIGKLDTSRGTSEAKVEIYPAPYWCSLDRLKVDIIVLLADNTVSVVESIQTVSIMSNPQYGFIQGHNQFQWWNEDSGSYIDFSEIPPVLHAQDYNTLFNEEVRSYPNNGEWDFPVKTRKVYSFEVADYHTYFVGKGGIWVHNISCGGEDS